MELMINRATIPKHRQARLSLRVRAQFLNHNLVPLVQTHQRPIRASQPHKIYELMRLPPGHYQNFRRLCLRGIFALRAILEFNFQP